MRPTWPDAVATREAVPSARSDPATVSTGATSPHDPSAMSMPPGPWSAVIGIPQACRIGQRSARDSKAGCAIVAGRDVVPEGARPDPLPGPPLCTSDDHGEPGARHTELQDVIPGD